MSEDIRRPVNVAHLGKHPAYGQLLDYLGFFERHGCIVGPSDTCWGVFTAATDPEGVKVVHALTGNLPDPMPVVVPSVLMASQTINLRDMHESFLKLAWPGAIIGVSDSTKKARFIRDIVNPGGKTIGVRVSEGTIEARLSIESGVPIVSRALRYADKRPVRDGVDAHRMVCEAMTMRQIPEAKVGFVRTPDKFRYSTHSTVGELVTDHELVRVLREGVLTRQHVADLVAGIKRSWTDPEAQEEVT